jgi:hypothetical protein
VQATVCSSPGHWYAAFGQQDVVLVEVSATTSTGTPPVLVQRRCAHEVGFRVLSRLCHAYNARACAREAAGAAALLRAINPCPDA